MVRTKRGKILDCQRVVSEDIPEVGAQRGCVYDWATRKSHGGGLKGKRRTKLRRDLREFGEAWRGVTAYL